MQEYHAAFGGATGGQVTANFGALAFVGGVPSGFTAWNGKGVEPPPPQPGTPAALTANSLNWTCVANWDFGADPGRVKVSQLFADGWTTAHYSDGSKFVYANQTGSNGLSGAIGQWGNETSWAITGDTDQHIQYSSDHMDLIQIYHDGIPTYRPQPTDSGFGVVTAPVLFFNTNLLGLTTTEPFCYVEGEFRIGDDQGSIDNGHYPLNFWPAWWCIGWNPNQGDWWYDGSWGPEIDCFEFYDAHAQSVVLHAPGPTQDNSTLSYCFSASGNGPANQITPTDTSRALPQHNIGANVTGPVFAPVDNNNPANFTYTPGSSFGAGWHKFGCLLRPDFKIEIWTDNILLGRFDANQFCDDGGLKVVPRLIIDLASNPWAAPFGATDYGGVNNTDANNHYRLGIRNIQIWTPGTTQPPSPGGNAQPVSPQPATKPAAVASTNWQCYDYWNFGTAAGNNVQKLTDWTRGQDYHALGDWHLVTGWANASGDAMQWGNMTGVSCTTNTDPHFQMFSDHADIVAIYHGGAASGANGAITCPTFTLNPNLVGITQSNPFCYAEITCKVPAEFTSTGMWPAWWCIGWNDEIAAGWNQYAGWGTWGPEIDIFEFWSQSDAGGTRQVTTLHAPSSNAPPPSYCFTPLGETEYPGTNRLPRDLLAAGASEVATTNPANLVYAPGVDFSQGWHKFGMKLNTDYSIELWTDDVHWATIHASQYRDDSGTRHCAPYFIIDQAIWGTPDYSSFGGINNSSATNRWRYGIKNIQIWKP